MTTESALDLARRTDIVHAVISGPPRPQPRPRAQIVPTCSAGEMLARAHSATRPKALFGLFRTHIYTPTAALKWKKHAQRELELAKRAAGYGPRPMVPKGQAIEVLILVVTELAKSNWRVRSPIPRRWLLSRRGGDFDNFAKAICDAATGVLWHDDEQVVRALVETVVAAQEEEPRLEIIARPCWDDPARTRFEQELRGLGLTEGDRQDEHGDTDREG